MRVQRVGEPHAGHDTPPHQCGSRDAERRLLGDYDEACASAKRLDKYGQIDAKSARFRDQGASRRVSKKRGATPGAT